MSLARSLRLRAIPTLLRVGVAETVAYRAEFLIWILTTTLPLVMLALWTSVANEAPFRSYTSSDFVAYYLAGLIVRNLTGSWVAWQISEEIRTGAMSMRLLRPIHPFVAFAASHVAAIPFRAIVAVPIAIVLADSAAVRSALATEPIQLVLLVPSLALAWLITFACWFMLGIARASSFTKSMALLEPLLRPVLAVLGATWCRSRCCRAGPAPIAEVSPFRYMLSVPVELMTRTIEPAASSRSSCSRQLAWTLVTLFGALWVWRRGLRRFEAVGG